MSSSPLDAFGVLPPIWRVELDGRRFDFEGCKFVISNCDQRGSSYGFVISDCDRRGHGSLGCGFVISDCDQRGSLGCGSGL